MAYKRFLSELAYIIFCSAGIMYSYLEYAILQERIYKVAYDGVFFSNHLFIIFSACCTQALVAFVALYFTKSKIDETPTSDHLQVAFAFIGSTFLSNSSLSFVSYPTQILVKSCKIIPVMIMGTKLNSLRRSEYVSTFIITLGVIVYFVGIFVCTAISYSLDKEFRSYEFNDSLFGMLMLLTSLCFDGFVGPKQDSIRAKYKCSDFQLMFGSNFYSALLCSPILLYSKDVFDFGMKHNGFFHDYFLLLVYSSVGQVFIFMILSYGSILLTVITTLRKFTTIVGSIVRNNIETSVIQALAIGFVFIGSSLNVVDTILQKIRHKKV